MKYVYVSPALPENVFGELLGYGKGSPGQQAQKYNKLLAKGISLNGRDVLMLSAPPVPPGSRPFKMTKLKPAESGGLSYRFLNVLDIPVIKNIYTLTQAKKEIKRIAKASPSPEDVCVVCDLLTLSASLGALKAAKSLGVRSCGIVTDLPEFLSGKPSGKRYAKLYRKAVSLCGSFVLLTEKMAEALPIGGRPYTVIEGISTPFAKPSAEPSSGSKKRILYAGGIEKAYGVEKLVKAFLKAGVKDSELLLCGDGSYAEELSEIASKNDSVKYIGVIPNENVMALEAESSLLVNPRTSEGAFTAYSFPSKNIEYLSTGTPVLAYMLPGIPEEYREYFITPEDESEDALAAKINETLAMSGDSLKAFGKRAAEFAAEKKAPPAQAARLLTMVESEGEKD